MPPPEKKELGTREVLPLRVGRDFPQFAGVDQVSDPGSIPPDHFRDLINGDITGYRVTERAGLSKTVSGQFSGGAIKGVWDLETVIGEVSDVDIGDDGGTKGGGAVTEPPVSVVPGGSTTLSFNHVGTGRGPGNDDPNTWLCDPTPTTDANKITYINDANSATGIYPPRTEKLQYLGIAAPAIADGLVIKSVRLHVIPHVITPPETDEVWAYGLAQIGTLNPDTGTSTPISTMADAVQMDFIISRPGGGTWHGSDLKNPSFQAGVFFVWGGRRNDFFRVAKMWLTYET